jgi:hypothetical protein
MRMLLVAAAAIVVGCGGTRSANPVSPSTPAPAAEIPAAPIARLGISIDARGALVAIQSLSNVRIDASGSSGSGLRYALDFGDGQGVDSATAAHVYDNGGRTFKVRAIVTDLLGRTDMAMADVPVKSVEGSWYNSFYNAAATRYESRTLTISNQAGLTVAGLYTHPEGNITPFNGVLVPERGVTLTLQDHTITFSSSDAGGFSSDATALNVSVAGGSATGGRLVFTR